MLKLITIVVLFSGMVWASEAKSWSHDSWMSELDGSKLFTQIAIPGTHDSATDWDHVMDGNCSLEIEFVSTQSYDISTQLNMGIRFFDIRLAYEDGVLKFHHGPCDLLQDFDSALNAAQDFLADNDDEFIIFLIKQEHTSVSEDAFWKRAHSLYFSKNEDLFLLDKRVLTVDEARGKIIIMGRKNSSEYKSGYHVNWDSNTSHYEHYSVDKDINDVMRYIVEDHYSMFSVSPEKKYVWIAQNLDLSVYSTPYGYQKTLFITFLSGEGNPNTDKTPRKIANYINPLTAHWLNSSSYIHPGIVAIDLAGDPDYYGDTIIKAVINQNFKPNYPNFD